MGGGGRSRWSWKKGGGGMMNMVSFYPRLTDSNKSDFINPQIMSITSGATLLGEGGGRNRKGGGGGGVGVMLWTLVRRGREHGNEIF